MNSPIETKNHGMYKYQRTYFVHTLPLLHYKNRALVNYWLKLLVP